MRRFVLVSAVSAAGVASLVFGDSAQATTFSKQGLTATATTTIKPKRLPANGTAPVTMDINVRTTRTTPGTPPNLTLRTVAFRTDKQITVDTEGLPSCPREKVNGTNSLREARKACRSSLIGSGKATAVLQFPEREPAALHYSILLFNTIENGKSEILLYEILHGGIEELGLAGVIGNIRNFKVGIPNEFDLTVSNTLQLKVGATWKHRGKRHSYLNGRCASGTIKNKITMTMSNGSVSETTPQRCTKRG